VSTSELVSWIDLQGLVINIIVAAVFFGLGNFFQKRVVADLKNYIGRELIPYEKRLLDAINNLEGKNIEGEGQIVVERNDDGTPIKVRMAPPQIISLKGVESDEEVGTFSTDIGPPPRPPQSVSKDLPLGWRTEANRDERNEQDS
jgi:hypothetical protein